MGEVMYLEGTKVDVRVEGRRLVHGDKEKAVVIKGIADSGEAALASGAQELVEGAVDNGEERESRPLTLQIFGFPYHVQRGLFKRANAFGLYSDEELKDKLLTQAHQSQFTADGAALEEHQNQSISCPPSSSSSTSSSPSCSPSLDGSTARILVSHIPPYGVGDIDHGSHMGSVGLMEAIMHTLQPHVHQFGHNHSNPGVWRVTQSPRDEADDETDQVRNSPNSRYFVNAAQAASPHPVVYDLVW